MNFDIKSVSEAEFSHAKNTNLRPAKAFIDLPHQVPLPSADSMSVSIAPSLVSHPGNNAGGIPT